MKVIPVIDLKAGQVVHAVRGQRQHYRPIEQFSCLTASSDPLQVLEDLLRLFAFDGFYIADLDAICENGKHDDLITELLTRYPNIEFWIDQGRQIGELSAISANRREVVATESQQSPACPINPQFLLSLDFNQQALGHPSWFEQADCWPNTLLVMTLARVGSQLGPDWQVLSNLINQHPDKTFIAAGGVRNVEDLRRLEQIGVGGALVATALHSGSLKAAELAGFQAKKYPG